MDRELIPLPFHGQSSREDVEAVLSDPSMLASTGKYPLGQNKSLFSPLRRSLHLMLSKSYGLHIGSRDLLDRALYAQMLQNQGSLSPM